MNQRRIAWLSPFPPQRSGIANYSYWLVKELRNAFEIDLYFDGEAPCAELQNLFATHPLSEFESRREQYHRVVYHLGNNHKFHTGIYRTAWNFPGTAVLHDYDLSGFMHEAFYRSNPDLYFQATANETAGPGGQRNAAPAHRLVPPGRSDPMSHAIVDRSRKVIVHHRWVKEQLGDSQHIRVVPHFARLSYSPTDSDLSAFRNRVGIKTDHFVLACLGFINPNKLPHLQIDVVKRLLEEGYPVQLIFAGEPAPELMDLVREVSAGQLAENIIFTGYQSDLDYFCAIASADVIINLRHPSMGEASGTLMHALATAKPTIVSDANQYREFPDKVCWKLVHDQNENELLFEYLRTLLSEPRVRTAMSANAAEYVENVLAMDKVRAHWIRALTT
ncbi:MAG: glycosyltransferase family 4 protein [Acidobacteriota bacterium]